MKYLAPIASIALGTLFLAERAFAIPCGYGPFPACAVPEPDTLPLTLLGLVGAVVVARFFKKK